jgi:HAD superfamily hydrolase (TIGR01509 family)
VSGAVGAFDLVIFDCDGVLVDSERLAVRVEAEVLCELGWPMTEEEVAERFVGHTVAYMESEVSRRIGHPIDWHATFGVRHREVFEAELVAVDGVTDVVSTLLARGVPMCVASSSLRQALEFKLRRTGLWDAFAGNVFSTEDVDHAKPAPDIFLHAAAAMGAYPSRCAVIEDSVAGVAAGVAAGMTVFAFGGGVTSAERLARPGATVFHEMSELLDLLAGEASVRPPG